MAGETRLQRGTGWEVVLIIILLLMAISYGIAYHFGALLGLIRDS